MSTVTLAELQAITHKMADIEMPPAVDWQPLIITVAIMLTLSILAFVIYRANKHQVRQENQIGKQALSELNKLQQQWQQKTINDQNTAYRLCALLRLGLQQQQITTTPPQQLAKYAQQWRTTIKQLEQLRYTPKAQHCISTKTFEQIQHWLKEGSNPC